MRVVVAGDLRVQIIEDSTHYRHVGFPEPLDIDCGGFPFHHIESDNKNNSINQRKNIHRITDSGNRWSINDNAVVPQSKFLDKIGKSFTSEKLGWTFGAATRWEHIEVRKIISMNYTIQVLLVGQVLDNPRAPINVQSLRNIGHPEVGIDNDGSLTVQRKGDGCIGTYKGFAFAGNCAG